MPPIRAPLKLAACGRPVADVREHWTANRPLYDPAAISRPVLIIRAEWDIDVSRSMVADLFDRPTGVPCRRSVEIGEGTHMLLLERNRVQAFEAAISFLNETFEPST